MAFTLTPLQNFQDADDTWEQHLRVAFGAEARQARFQARGEGEPGSEMRKAFDDRTAARIAWENSR